MGERGNLLRLLKIDNYSPMSPSSCADDTTASAGHRCNAELGRRWDDPIIAARVGGQSVPGRLRKWMTERTNHPWSTLRFARSWRQAQTMRYW